MSIKQIIAEIEKLSEKEKSEVYNHLRAELTEERKKYALNVLEKLRGRGRNILNLDPQEYIRTLRSDDRV